MTGLILVILMAIGVTVLNRPQAARLETARTELARAGYPDAQVGRSQSTGNMVRCEVSQVRANRGYAYGWQTADHAGVFCLPTDGRPTRILVNGQAIE